MKQALVFLAEGVEEMEAVIAVDVLRRAGIEVVTASTGAALEVLASRGVRLLADAMLETIDPAAFDAVVIPGGAGGSRRLSQDPRVLQIVRDAARAGRCVAAVCAGPLVLQAAGVLAGVRITCHPGVRDQFPADRVCDARVVEDGLFITSQGPGTSLEFALAIAARLVGAEIASRVGDGLLLPPSPTPGATSGGRVR